MLRITFTCGRCTKDACTNLSVAQRREVLDVKGLILAPSYPFQFCLIDLQQTSEKYICRCLWKSLHRRVHFFVTFIYSTSLKRTGQLGLYQLLIMVDDSGLKPACESPALALCYKHRQAVYLMCM